MYCAAALVLEIALNRAVTEVIVVVSNIMEMVDQVPVVGRQSEIQRAEMRIIPPITL